MRVKEATHQNPYSANKSAKSGAQPAKLSGTSERERTNEHAKALAHDTESSSATSSTKRRRPTLARRLVPGQLAHRVNGLGAPPASSLQSDNYQLTARAVEQFGVFPLFVGSGSLQHDTISVSCPRCGQTRCGSVE